MHPFIVLTRIVTLYEGRRSPAWPGFIQRIRSLQLPSVAIYREVTLHEICNGWSTGAQHSEPRTSQVWNLTNWSPGEVRSIKSRQNVAILCVFVGIVVGSMELAMNSGGDYHIARQYAPPIDLFTEQWLIPPVAADLCLLQMSESSLVIGSLPASHLLQFS